MTFSVPWAPHGRFAPPLPDAERDEHGLLAVDGVARDAAVQHVAAHEADVGFEGAESLGGAHQRGRIVPALQRARHEQAPSASARSDDEDLHGPDGTPRGAR